jgi:hypothetical protein
MAAARASSANVVGDAQFAAGPEGMEVVVIAVLQECYIDSDYIIDINFNEGNFLVIVPTSGHASAGTGHGVIRSP